MCLFVVVGAKASPDGVTSAFGHHFCVTEAQNPELASVIPKPMTPFWVTRGGCSCELGVYERTTPDQMRHRLEKKGWSKNKIERAVAQSMGPGTHAPEPERLRQFREGLVSLAAVGPVLVLGHWFRGAQDAEAIGSLKAVDVSPEQVLLGPLPELEEALLRIPKIVGADGGP